MISPLEISEMTQTGDVRAKRIAKVYAESLYEAASNAGVLEPVIEELEAIVRDVLGADSRLDVVFSSPAIGRYARAEILAKAFKDRVHPTVYGFLQVVNGHERLDLLRPIARALRELYEERARRVRVFVTSAAPMNEQEMSLIGDVVRSALALEPILVPIVDPSILGGVKIRAGDRQYDATVRTRIENIRNQILTSSSHEIQSRRDRFCSANGDRAVPG